MCWRCTLCATLAPFTRISVPAILSWLRGAEQVCRSYQKETSEPLLVITSDHLSIYLGASWSRAVASLLRERVGLWCQLLPATNPAAIAFLYQSPCNTLRLVQLCDSLPALSRYSYALTPKVYNQDTDGKEKSNISC